MGIEPTCEAWKASVLPLNYARVRGESHPHVNARPCVVNSTPLVFVPRGTLTLFWFGVPPSGGLGETP